MKRIHFYEFQGFYADLKQKRLWKNGEIISITPKAFDTLIYLLQHKGEVVKKEEILDAVWADIFVDEATLSQNIYTLRKVLGTMPNGKQIIETITRRGFLFNAEVREINADKLEITENQSISSIFDEEKELTESNQKVGNETADQNQPKKFWKNPFLVFAGFLIFSLLISFLVFRFLKNPVNLAETKFREIKFSKITSSGNVHRIALSPDGKYLAYVEKKEELQNLYIRQLNNANTIEIIPPSKDNFIGLTFSSDSEYIYYTIYPEIQENPSFNLGTLYKIPILGGTRTEIVKNIDTQVTLSPDGKRIAFIRNSFINKSESAIIIKDIENNVEKSFATREGRERFTANGVFWSPDGKYLACIAFSDKEPAKPLEMLVFNTETSEKITLMTESWNWIGQLAWLKDSSGIIFPAYGNQTNNLTDEIWLISFPEGKLRQITNGINGFNGIGVSADSNSIVTLKSDIIANIWKGNIENIKEATRIKQGLNEVAFSGFGMDFTIDGKILYAASQNGNADIWTLEADGTNPKQITNEISADYAPSASPDGCYIVFVSNRSGYHNLWRVETNGNNPFQITNSGNIYSPSISPDSKWIYYTAAHTMNTPPFLWKVSIEGGESIKLTEKAFRMPKISPDGKYIAGYFPDANPDSKIPKKMKLTILSAQDGSLVKQFSVPINDLERPLAWTPNSEAITFWRKEKGVANFWQQSLNSETPKQLTDWQTDEIFRMAYSKDGKYFAFERGNLIDDIILIQDTTKSSQ